VTLIDRLAINPGHVGFIFVWRNLLFLQGKILGSVSHLEHSRASRTTLLLRLCSAERTVPG
jgi:hypothetical protein